MKKVSYKLAAFPIIIVTSTVALVLIPLQAVGAKEQYYYAGYVVSSEDSKDISSNTVHVNGAKWDGIMNRKKNDLKNSKLLKFLDLKPREYLELRRKGMSLEAYARKKNLSMHRLKELMRQELNKKAARMLEEGVVNQNSFGELIQNMDKIVERFMQSVMPVRLSWNY